MASDIKIIWNDIYQEGDIKYDNGDLVREEGLETAVLMSLYTDQRADVDDVLPDPGSEDRRGWWGDQISDFEDDKIGSKLWLLERSSTKATVLSDVKFYIEQALQWMIDDGVAQAIEVTVERQNRKDGSATLATQIQIKQSGGGIVAIKFDDLWKAQLAA